MLELEQAVQSQGTTTATGSDQPHISPEEFAVLESKVEARHQAFTGSGSKSRGVGSIHSVRSIVSVKSWAQGRLEHIDRQIKGLKSFALSVE